MQEDKELYFKGVIFQKKIINFDYIQAENNYEVRVFMYMSSTEGPRHTDIITE